MSKTLQSFGTVLFDELEQIAVRRGRFASLEWTRIELEKAREQVQGALDDANALATDPIIVEQRADLIAAHAVEILLQAASAFDAVARLGQVASARSVTSLCVVERIREPGPPPERPVAFYSIASLFDAIGNWARPVRKLADWRECRDDVRSKLEVLADKITLALDGLRDVNLRGEFDAARDVEKEISRVRRISSGLNRVEDLIGDDRARVTTILAKLDGSYEDQDLAPRLRRGTVIARSSQLLVILNRAIQQLEQVIAAYRKFAESCRGISTQLGRLVDVQPDETRYEIGDIVEDDARTLSHRLETVGLAFSGGGIRSATFNLGFLQGMASHGLLKQFDYLSTVSGGGYIGAWLAAWVRREGGPAGEPQPPTKEDVDRAAEPLIAMERRRIRKSPGMSPQEIEKAEAAAAQVIRDKVRVELHSAYTAMVEAPPLPTPGEAEPGENAPKPPGEDDVARVAEPRIATERKRIQQESKSKASRGQIAQQVARAEKRIREEEEANLKRIYDEQVASKRRRTAQALENVELQLNSSRAVQGRANRRWVSAEEIRNGREESKSPPPPLRRVVEEEPEPIYHLRAFSNFLTPKLGLTSLDTWAMVSVYLRNLFLNQLILLPMMLALIAVPRLGLILFARLNPRTDLGVVGRWLGAHPWWPAVCVLSAAAVAVVTAPRLVDYLAKRIGRRAGRVYGRRRSGWAIFLACAIALAYLTWEATAHLLPRLRAYALPEGVSSLVAWLEGFPLATSAVAVAALILVSMARKNRGESFIDLFARWATDRTQGWAFLAFALLTVFLTTWGFSRVLHELTPVLGWLTVDWLVLIVTSLAAAIGFNRIYRTVALIRESRRPMVFSGVNGSGRFDLPFPILWEQILVPLVLVAFGVSLLFTDVGKGFSELAVQTLGEDHLRWLRLPDWLEFPLLFGLLVGSLRLLAGAFVRAFDRSQRWGGWETAGRAATVFVSGLIGGTALSVVLTKLNGGLGENPGVLAAGMMTFGPLLVMIAMGVGSTIEVGLIGAYAEEDMREWRASLGAYLLMLGLAWAAFSSVSIYGPLLICYAPRIGSAAGLGWVITSAMGAFAGRSAQTDGSQGSKGLLEYVALVAPPVFILGLVVAIAMLATSIQGVDIAYGPSSIRKATATYLDDLSNLDKTGRTWAMLLGSAWLATIGCAYVNINLFSLNTFYANRLVRCYLGASRPRETTAEGRSMFAPTNCPVPVRRPNPITGFDPTDDFPMRDLAIVRNWGDDLVVDYRGPYHLVNTAMNLVAGTELAWQERLAESFVLSPLYCGSKTTGFRKTDVHRSDLEDTELEPEERLLGLDSEVTGYGSNIRLGTAVSVSGAAASPNAGYHSSPLVTILLTVFNARLGLWFGNPARTSWRKSGPGFALYLVDELLGRTTNKGKYVYLSDGGHFENLGVYELIRRRCQHIVVCDAGADPSSSFWDLGGLVRKCREDFGVRIEIDISPLSAEDNASRSKWHCAVGSIHYEDVDKGAKPGTLLYVKPSLTGDEPSDVRNYVVDHPTFPHETTADQFFSESQFESYRVLGEHIAAEVFRDAATGPNEQVDADAIFSRLRRRWFPPPPGHDETFLDSVKPFVEIHQSLRSEELRPFAAELYPEFAQPMNGNGNGNGSTAPKELHLVIEMLQAMEIAWMTAGLDSHASHPLNRGWMNVFRRWANSKSFRSFWPTARGEFSEGFVRFCETELGLKVAESEVIWLDSNAANPWSDVRCPYDPFVAALGVLDEEFAREWPNLSVPEIGTQLTLSSMFNHAKDRPPVDGYGALAGLIQSGPQSQCNGAQVGEPRLYGAVLAWRSSHNVIDLMLWVRGAYRTLGIGGKTVKALRDALAKPHGIDATVILRARYPFEQQGVLKRRWQGNLWADLFQSQGFHPVRLGPSRSDRDVDENFITLERPLKD